MKTAARILAVSILLILSIPAPAKYESLGITRAQVEDMLRAEGLNPKPNKYPDFEGEPVTELIVFDPQISFKLFGSDGGLTGIELSMRPSSDSTDAYWQGYLCLWVLNAIFPNWENREEWLNRTIKSFAEAGNKGKVKFQRDDRTIEAAAGGGHFFLAVNGQEIE